MGGGKGRGATARIGVIYTLTICISRMRTIRSSGYESVPFQPFLLRYSTPRATTSVKASVVDVRSPARPKASAPHSCLPSTSSQGDLRLGTNGRGLRIRRRAGENLKTGA